MTSASVRRIYTLKWASAPREKEWSCYTTQQRPNFCRCFHCFLVTNLAHLMVYFTRDVVSQIDLRKEQLETVKRGKYLKTPLLRDWMDHLSVRVCSKLASTDQINSSRMLPVEPVVKANSWEKHKNCFHQEKPSMPFLAHLLMNKGCCWQDTSSSKDFDCSGYFWTRHKFTS